MQFRMASILPAIEITFVDVGTATIEDESTKDGKEWLNAFIQGATTILGCRRACWGVSDKYPNLATHFIGRGKLKTAFNEFVVNSDPVRRLRDGIAAACAQAKRLQRFSVAARDASPDQPSHNRLVHHLARHF